MLFLTLVMVGTESAGGRCRGGSFGAMKLSGRNGRALAVAVTIIEHEFNAVRALGGFDGVVDETTYLFRKRLGATEFDVLLAQSLDRGNDGNADQNDRFARLLPDANAASRQINVLRYLHNFGPCSLCIVKGNRRFGRNNFLPLKHLEPIKLH